MLTMADDSSLIHPPSSMLLASLPDDAYHGIATFLTPSDFRSLSATCHFTRRACRPVWNKIRLHAIRCANEVKVALELGYVADARELMSTYLAADVPLYPLANRRMSKQYAFKTFSWRLPIERLYGTYPPISEREAEWMETRQQQEEDEFEDDDDEVEHTDDERTLMPYLDAKDEFFDNAPLTHLHLHRATTSNESCRTMSTDFYAARTDVQRTYAAPPRSVHNSLDSFETEMHAFWDAVFPKTAGVAYYNGHSPVPRESELNSFLTRPIPREYGVIQCEIERINVKSSSHVNGSRKLFPTYEYRLFIRSGRDEMVFMTAKNKGRPSPTVESESKIRRRSARATTGKNHNYALHLPTESKELGRLQSNLMGTEFTIYLPQEGSLPMKRPQSTRRHSTGGVNKRGKSWLQSRISRRAIAAQGEEKEILEQPMEEMENGAITYTANLLGNRPRIMDVCLPHPSSFWEDHDKTMLSRLKDNDACESFQFLQNKPPWWNTELGAFVLNFGGRVSVASVKNFQLMDRMDPDYILLQFGRIEGRHKFTMDFQYPLTAVQAFAICISSLQSKLSLG